MNLVSNYVHVPLSPVNPATQSLRQDNLVREIIRQPTQAEGFPKEPGIAKEHEQQRHQGKETRVRLAGSDPSLSLTESKSANSTDVVDAITDEPSSNQQGQQQNSEQQDNSPQEARSSSEREPSDTSEDHSQAEAAQQQEFLKQIRQLQRRDQEVRAHEQAHSSVGGQYTGAPRLQYENGPDGQQYAVAGEVRIDISPIPGDPQATIQKMRLVRAAALAPAEPSAQDLKVAAEANRQITEAQGQLLSGDDTSGSNVRTGERRRLTGDELSQRFGGMKFAQFEKDKEQPVEVIMAQRNQVIASTYRNSSLVSISGLQLSV